MWTRQLEGEEDMMLRKGNGGYWSQRLAKKEEGDEVQRELPPHAQFEMEGVPCFKAERQWRKVQGKDVEMGRSGVSSLLGVRASYP